MTVSPPAAAASVGYPPVDLIAVASRPSLSMTVQSNRGAACLGEVICGAAEADLAMGGVGLPRSDEGANMISRTSWAQRQATANLAGQFQGLLA
jgi:hypothetical protein